jgi:predicted permease
MLIRFCGLFSKRQKERAFADELESHLQLHIDDNMRLGMDAQQARRAAIMKLGGLEMTKQSHRERRTLPILDDVMNDLRFAFRQLKRSPGFTATIALMLALGIGASVAIFAFVDSALLKALPYRDPTRLVSVTETVKLLGRANISYPDYLDWKRMNHSFSSLDVYSGGGILLNTPTGTVPVSGVRVSDGFFHTLGVIPILGRDFLSGEDLPATADIVILSYQGWQKWFNGRPDIIGQKVSLSGVPNTIVGVLPQNFDFAPRGGTQFWMPFHAHGSCDLNRSCHGLEGIARLKDGVTLQAASAEMKSIAADLERLYPGSNRDQGATVDPLSDIIVGDYRPILLTLLAGAGLLLMIACINVSSLLLVRSESRRREMSVRSALGASRIRLIRQFVVESVVLVILGSVLGVGCAYGAMHALSGLIPKFMMSRMPFLQGLSLNAHTLLFALGIAFVAVCMFAVTPILRLPVADMQEGLAEGARGSAGRLWRRLGANLVVLELAVAVVLLVGAGLLGKSFYRLLHVDVNFNPDHLALVGVMVPPNNYPTDEKNIALQRLILSRVTTLPGVQSAAFTCVPPVSYNGNTDWIRFVGRPYNGEHNEVNLRDVSSNYFKTLQARLIHGKLFDDSVDGTKPKVVIINQALAKMYFPAQDPVGQRIGDDGLTPNSIKEIIGVVDDIREGALDSEIVPAVYYPIYQDEDTYFTLLVRTSQSPGSILPSLVSTISSIDTAVGTADPITFEERTNQGPTAYLHRSSAYLVSGFAFLALVLGIVGLYGVVAYSVAQRTREIGIRMALGAQRASVYRLVIMEAGRLTIAGIGLGLICSVGAATMIRKLLFGTAAWDFVTLASVAAVLGISALAASYIPARRAASVDPVEALRAE